MQILTLDEYAELTGLSLGSILSSAGLNPRILGAWRNGQQTPSLLSVISLFCITDGHVGIWDLLSLKDQYLLDRFLDKLPPERINELIIELQNHFNTYTLNQLREDCDLL